MAFRRIRSALKPVATKAAYAGALLNPITALPAAIYGLNYQEKKMAQAEAGSLITMTEPETPEQTAEKTRIETLRKKREGELRGETPQGRAATILTQKSKNKTLLG